MIIALRPPRALYNRVIEQAIDSVSQPDQPSIISPNFIAARLTAPITKTLKIRPKYNALNPRRNAAGFPPYLSS